MKKSFQNIYEYIKLVLQEWYWFLGLIPSFLDNVSLYLPEKYNFTIPSQYTFIYVLALFPVISYRIWKKAKQKNIEPKIIIEYDLSSFNICYLRIKNIGNRHASDIKTIFTPDIKINDNKTINNSNFCKKLNQLTPGQSIRFFFGTFTEEKILRRFDIQITYYDLESGEKYTDSHVIDPSTFIGTSSQESEDKTTKELKEIASNLKKLVGHISNIPETLKAGISIRNIDLEDLSENELKNLLRNMCLYGTEEDFLLNPFIGDTRQIIKCLRNKLMIKDSLSEGDKKFIEKVNIIHKYQPYIGSGNVFKEEVCSLFKEKTNSHL